MTTKTEERNIEAIEADIEQAEVRLGELRVEQGEIQAALATGTSDEKLLEAAMSGKSLAGTQRIGKLQARSDEISEMVRVLDSRLLRLKLERVAIREAELQEELEAAGELVMKKREAESQAAAERQEAENQIARMRDETYTLRDRRRALESRLLENDPQYRQQAEAAALERREAAEPTQEQAEQYRRQLRESHGAVFYDTPEEFAAMAEEAERQGVKLTPFGRVRS
jgi:hypothetical protein